MVEVQPAVAFLEDSYWKEQKESETFIVHYYNDFFNCVKVNSHFNLFM